MKINDKQEIGAEIACQLCGWNNATMEDPTFDKLKVVLSARETAKPLLICDGCAKYNIERAMYAN